eukprot:SAG31_NODE_4077_length_3611_cov_1.879556_1_plen_85_part_00
MMRHASTSHGPCHPDLCVMVPREVLNLVHMYIWNSTAVAGTRGYVGIRNIVLNLVYRNNPIFRVPPARTKFRTQRADELEYVKL